MTMQEIGFFPNIADYGRLTPMEGITPGEGGLTTVFTSLDDPGRVVKSVDTLWSMQQRYRKIYGQAEFTEFVANPIGIITSPEHDISRFIPPTELAWGMGEDAEHGFVIMPRINGQELVAMQHIDNRTASQLDELIAASLRVDMAVGEVSRNMRIRPDIIRAFDRGHRIHNIIVGTYAPGQSPQPWIHDVYPTHYFDQFESMTVGQADWMEALVDLRGRSSGYIYPQAHAAVNEFYSRGPRSKAA